MTTNVFVGPDGRAYAEHKPDEGGFLSYFDGCMWLITFPINHELERSYFFHGKRLPSSANEWKMQLVNTESPFPAFIESCSYIVPLNTFTSTPINRERQRVKRTPTLH